MGQIYLKLMEIVWGVAVEVSEYPRWYYKRGKASGLVFKIAVDKADSEFCGEEMKNYYTPTT